jgi:membrane dipeptidase
MNYLIDAHEDLAYNALSFGRDYTRSAFETRRLEEGTETPVRTGQTLLGWPEYQQGRVALIFGTLFIAPRRHQGGEWDTQSYENPEQAARLHQAQIDYYYRLVDRNPDKFCLVRTRSELKGVLDLWTGSAPTAEGATHKVGLLMSMEGAEGLRRPEDLEEYYEKGVRAVGPVWAGSRFCGGTYEPGGFTQEGYQLLETMAGLGYILDIAHMNEKSAQQALDAFSGTIIASHANARALLKELPGERHLSDEAIRRLAEHDGVIGILPFNKFLVATWERTDDPKSVTLQNIADHIDHVCQLTGSAAHVAIGTDFDGGFGWPAVPYEINTIADMPKLGTVLQQRGYSEADIALIEHGNWLRVLERSLP